MNLQVGDELILKKRYRIDAIYFPTKTVLLTDMKTKKTTTYTFEALQDLDNLLNFDVKQFEPQKEKDGRRDTNT